MLNIIILLYALLGKPNSCQKELSTCSIQLVSIDCIKQEDDTGNDQVYLTLNGKEITSKYRRNKGLKFWRKKYQKIQYMGFLLLRYK